jgi:hypothetical protein
MKLNCIIDTCSCIILSNVHFRQKKLISYLNSKAFLNFSKEVKLELTDHRSKNIPHFLLHKDYQNLIKNNYGIYEEKLVGRKMISRIAKGSKGEIDNFILSIDYIHNSKKNSVILISDDNNSIINDWVEAFPVIKTWTSFDVILFLYTEKIIPSKEMAIDLIKELIHFTYHSETTRSQKTTEKVTKILTSYNKKIEKINNYFN